MRVAALLLTLLASEAMAGRPMEIGLRARARGPGGSASVSTAPVFGFLPAATSFTECSDAATYTGTNAEALTFVRGSTATCMKGNGTMVAMSTGKPRVQCDSGGINCGLLVEGSTVNYALNSDAMGSSTLTSGDITITDNQYNDLRGLAVMDKVTVTVVGNVAYQDRTVPSGTNFVASCLTRADSGTQEVTCSASCLTAGSTPGCTCLRSDGGACTAATDSTACRAKATVGTTPVRLEARITCTTAATTMRILFAPGDFATTIGSAGFGNLQLEPGWAASSYMPAAGSNTTRGAEDAKFTNIAFGLTPCFSATVDPVTVASTGEHYFVLYPFNTPGNLWKLQLLLTTGRVDFRGYDGVTQPNSTRAVNPTIGPAFRVGGFWDGINMNACLSGTCTATARTFAPLSSTYTSMWVGSGAGSSSFLGGTIGNIIISPTSAECGL